ASDCCIDAGSRDGIDECERCVERPRSASLPGRHQRFERAAEHFRVNGGLVPCRRLLARGETVLPEHRCDEASIRVVGEHDATVLPLERRASEESTIEKWNTAECQCRGCSLPDGRVERSEKQGPQHPVVKPPAAFHAAIELMRDEGRVAVEPSLGLEK